MVPWTLGNDGWIERIGRPVAQVVTTPEDAGALVEAANYYPALLAAALAVVNSAVPAPDGSDMLVDGVILHALRAALSG